jgi:SAM-dependent methyltransferase
MILLFPGRHHLLTAFQFQYLNETLAALSAEGAAVEAVIFAVTSANHSNTRRNPLPFYLRAMQLQSFAAPLGVPFFTYGIDDVGVLPNFAEYTLKKIHHDSDGVFALSPANCRVICSTPVMTMYESLGYKILTAELIDRNEKRFAAPLPWDIVERIAASPDFTHDEWIQTMMHPASLALWAQYALDKKIKMLFRDTMISADGDITLTRNYESYVEQMDAIAELKFHDTKPFLRGGRIGDIGCAVGSWIKLACESPMLQESDFYGVEVVRHLYEICLQRKQNHAFKNPFVFFAQKNAVTGLAFEPNSMNTIHTSSLTHEIESYGSRKDLLAFIKNRYDELAPGGVWINRDVVAPHNPDEEVYLDLTATDGHNHDWDKEFPTAEELKTHLDGLSTLARFKRFANDFRQKENDVFHYEEVMHHEKPYMKLTLRNVAEFAMKKDYTDNWHSEMHEKFCFWTFQDWVTNLEHVGFRVLPSSAASRNEWIVENRFHGKLAFFTMKDGALQTVPFPVTHLLFIAEKVV